MMECITTIEHGVRSWIRYLATSAGSVENKSEYKDIIGVWTNIFFQAAKIDVTQIRGDECLRSATFSS